MTLFFRFFPFKPAGLSALFCAASLLATLSAHAESTHDLKQAIEKQKVEVAKTRTDQKQARKALQVVQNRLAKAQRSIDELQAKIEATDQALNRQLQKQSALSSRSDTLRKDIARGLQAAYRLGGSAAVSTLLARSDALATERDLHYLHDLLQPTLKDIETLRQTRRKLAENRQELNLTRAHLRQSREQLDAQQSDWQKQKDKQAALLAQLGEKLQDQSARLKELLAREKTLDAEVAAANKRSRNHHHEQADNAPEQTPEHGVHIPVGGKIIRAYGAHLGLGNLRSQGVIFSAPPGQPVRAITSGEVVYADHLKGWGNLVILRHRHNYLSLYAHNRQLKVHSGERVHRGQVLGVTGHLDAHRTGVYFEVRHGNNTINPAHWKPWRVARADH